MREGIHPKYSETIVKCACGESFTTGSTKKDLHVEICSKCHPFFTGETENFGYRWTRREIQEEIWISRQMRMKLKAEGFSLSL